MAFFVSSKTHEMFEVEITPPPPKKKTATNVSAKKQNEKALLSLGLVWVSNWLTFCKWSDGLIPH